MNLRRALIIGLGPSSLATLHKLREQFTARDYTDVPVVQMLLIDREGAQRQPPPEGAAPPQLPPGVSQFTLKQGESPTASTTLPPMINALINNLLQGDHIERLARIGIKVQPQTPIHLIIVGNLADEAVYTAVLDLAKAVYPIIESRQTITQPLAASLILGLPGVSQLGAQASDLGHRIYSQLDEINTYLKNAGNLYNDSSFRAIHHIYLLEPVNSAQMALPNLDSLFWMTGDWLYYFLTEELQPQGQFTAGHEPSGAPRAFRSLGYACLYVPVPQMTHILCDWFITKAFSDYLLATPGPRPDPQSEHVPSRDAIEEHLEKLAERQWREQGLTNDNIISELWAKIDRRSCQLLREAYSNTPFHQYIALEQRLAANYSDVLNDKLPKLRESQAKNHRAIIDSTRISLQVIRKYYLDELESGTRAPVRSAINFFERFAAELTKRGTVLRNEIEAAERKIVAMDRTIRTERGAFWDAAQTFGKPPFLVPIVALLTTLITIPYLAWLTWIYFGQPVLASVITVLTLGLMVGGFFVTKQRIENQKGAFIGRYAARLKLVVEQEDARALRKLYADMLLLTRLLQDELERFKTQLQNQLEPPVDEKRSPFAVMNLDDMKRRISPELERQLYDTPRYNLERSLLKPGDLEAWYNELFANVDKDLQTFFGQRPLSAWFREMTEGGHTAQVTLRAALEHWVRYENQTKLPRLRQEPIKRYLANYPDERRREIVEHMNLTARVYSRLNTVVSSSQESLNEQIHIRVAVSDQEYVKQILQDIGGTSPALQVTDEPWQLAALAFLPERSLDAFIAPLDLASATESNSVFTCPIMGHRLNSSMIVALAGPIKIIYKVQDNLGYDRIDKERELLEGIDNANVFHPLGTTYNIVVNQLDRPTESEHLGTIAARVLAGLKQLAEQEPNGRALILKLREYIRQLTIDPNERAQIEAYIQLLVKHLHAGKTQAAGSA